MGFLGVERVAPGRELILCTSDQSKQNRGSLRQPREVAVEVWCEDIQVKRVNECFQGVGHFLNSGVLLAAATLHLLTPGCQNDAEIAQIIKQLQGPILGHGERTFFLHLFFF